MSVRAVLLGVACAFALAVVSAAAFVWSGFYDVAATEQHTAPVYALIELTTQRSIARRARAIAPPALDDKGVLERGLQLYRTHCIQCHGAPGIAPEPFALGLTPAPANLALKARTADAAELFWIIKYGLKMTGMPAWEFRFNDDDIWLLAGFLKRLPTLAPVQYRALAAATPAVSESARLSTEAPDAQPDPRRGKIALQQYACVTCHVIPGVVGATQTVGPPLAGIGSRRYIAGILPNTRENMVAWLRSPTAVDARTAMPDLAVPLRDAQDIAALLETLR
jgi:mono/diheme cytochrome c family protein